MEDPEVVAAIVAGDPAGLAAAYDRYAVPLYSYCRSMLHEPADAADAVQDTFLIAAAKLRGLRDPGKLRPWLYAVARNESLRRLRAARGTTALEEAADVASQSGSLGRQAERADLHKLVRQAIDGLNPRDRDVIELNLGHDLEGDELADALGVSRNHAHALLSRARNQLERALGALIVARTGQQACPELAALLANWDGQLTVLTRKRISRHIERCDSCGERKRRELTPALFAGASPLVAVLPGFRDQLLSTMSDRTPAGLAHRMGVANRAGPFGPAGFPKPMRPLGVSPWHRTLQHSHAVVAGAAASVVAAGVIAVLVISGAHGPSAAGAETTHGAVIGTNGAAPAHGGPSARVGGGLTPAALGPGGSSSSGPLGPSPTAGSAPSGSAPAGAATSATSSGGSSPGSSASAGSTASASPSSAASTASKGSLSVSPGTLDLAAVNGTATGDVTITASGGPVSYSVAVGSSLAGKLTVSPSSGSLTAGQSVTVAVTSSSLLGLDGQLTVNPGGQSVTVLLSVGL